MLREDPPVKIGADPSFVYIFTSETLSFPVIGVALKTFLETFLEMWKLV